MEAQPRGVQCAGSQGKLLLLLQEQGIPYGSSKAMEKALGWAAIWHIKDRGKAGVGKNEQFGVWWLKAGPGQQIGESQRCWGRQPVLVCQDLSLGPGEGIWNGHTGNKGGRQVRRQTEG